MTWGILGLGVVLIVAALLLPGTSGQEMPAPVETEPPQTQQPTEETEEPTMPQIEYPIRNITPEAKDQTNPESYNIRWEIFENGMLTHAFYRADPIYMGLPEEYFALPGVPTFRGNNYRNNAAYGTVEITQQTISRTWTVESGVLDNGAWEGSGWTGQPLVVKWDKATKAIMTTMYPEKREKKDLVEVIYATLDGHIYFLDMEDGSATREPLNIGMCFKGSGSLDPRGYPLMYVGSGVLIIIQMIARCLEKTAH